MKGRIVVALVVAVVACAWAVEGWGWFGSKKPMSVTPKVEKMTVAGTIESYFSNGFSCRGKIGDVRWFVFGADRISLCQDLLMAQLFVAEVQLIVAKEAATPGLLDKLGEKHEVFGVSIGVLQVTEEETGFAPIKEGVIKVTPDVPREIREID